jgi:DHA1 family inner membrane transport protein
LKPRLRIQLIAVTLTRLVMNTAQRMVYPFLPAIGRGLGLPFEALTPILSLRGGLGMVAPAVGSLPDRMGRRLAMLIGLLIFCGALALMGLVPTYLAFAAAVILVVVAKFIFDPALQAYLADRTPYSRRGLVIGLSELGWSGAALVGIPLVGLAMARGGWRAPFLPMAGLGLVALVALALMLTADRPAAGQTARPGNWALVLRNPAVLAAMAVPGLLSAANESLNVVYGAWMEQAFHLPLAALGLSTAVIGIAELAGEGLVIGLADRLGKRRVIGVGVAASAAAYLALPFLTARLELALGGLFLVFITFELTIVATIPLMTELVPEARSRVLSATVAFHAGGRMTGALLGAALFPLGFVWNGWAAAALNVAALAVLVTMVREGT